MGASVHWGDVVALADRQLQAEGQLEGDLLFRPAVGLLGLPPRHDREVELLRLIDRLALDGDEHDRSAVGWVIHGHHPDGIALVVLSGLDDRLVVFVVDALPNRHLLGDLAEIAADVGVDRAFCVHAAAFEAHRDGALVELDDAGEGIFRARGERVVTRGDPYSAGHRASDRTSDQALGFSPAYLSSALVRFLSEDSDGHRYG